MNEAETRKADMPGTLLGFGGRIGRARYFGGLALTIVVLLVTIMFAASAMDPTGGGAPFLAVPLLAVFIWMFAVLGAQRFRDAGRSPALVLLQLLVLGLVIYPGLEVIETLWPLLLAAFLAALTYPGFLASKTPDSTAMSAPDA